MGQANTLFRAELLTAMGPESHLFYSVSMKANLALPKQIVLVSGGKTVSRALLPLMRQKMVGNLNQKS